MNSLNTAMSRPRPTILAEHTRNYKTEQVLAGTDLTALTYQGQPVNYRIVDDLTGKIQYPKTASTNPAWVRKLAEYLNHIYKTEDFRAQTMEPKND